MSRVTWIYNGVSAPTTAPEFQPAFREELKIPPNSPLCLMLATYEKRKGHNFLFQAFRDVVREMPEARLVVCGFGYPHEIESARRLVEFHDLSSHVTLEGFRLDGRAILAQVDLLLVPSQAYESFGLTSVEAMASRVPVIATRVGGIPEVVVEGEGGFLVDPKDVRSFADCILRLLRQPELRREQGQRGYERYRRLFSAERMATEYARIVHES